MSEDLNIDNYTEEDLVNILDLKDITKESILKKLTFYIDKFTNEKDEKMAHFFKEAQEKLLTYFQQQIYKNKQSDNWWTDQNLIQKDSVQNDKRTNRKNKVKIFENDNVPMKREALGINQVYDVPVAQGQLNPNLKNVTIRIVNIDSQFRQNSVPSLKGIKYNDIKGAVHEGPWSSTNFSLDLSDSLVNAISIRLYSLQIPYTWYNIDQNYGNNCFLIKYTIKDEESIELLIDIESGNYTTTIIQSDINSKIQARVDENTTYLNSNGSITYNSKTGKMTLLVPTVKAAYTLEKVEVIFYGNEVIANSSCSSCISEAKINNTLGWILGFRDGSYELTTVESIIGEAIVDLHGPRYFLLSVDDFNVNRLNKGLVTIQDTETKLSLPEYYKPSMIKSETDGKFRVVAPKSKEGALVETPVIERSYPRVMTQAQLYSVNQIIENRKNSPNEKVVPPTTSNILALIPIKKLNLNVGDMIVELNTSLSSNIRNYFGPVDIERLEIKLLDDKGNIVNLNGANWSFSLVSEHLYQY